MYEQFEPEYVRLTPNEVFSRLRDAFGPHGWDRDKPFTPGMTIADWRMEYGIVGWRELERIFRKNFGVSASTEDWKRALEPVEERTIADFCAFVAPRGRFPRVRAVSVCGRECYPAGAFLTIRSMLKDAGAPVDELAPSTPLDEYARRYSDCFRGPIEMLAPGVTWPARYKAPFHSAAEFVLISGSLLGFFGAWTLVFWSDVAYVMMLIGAALFGLGWVLCHLVNRFVLPKWVTFGEMRTFRDMAVEVARRSSARVDHV